MTSSDLFSECHYPFLVPTRFQRSVTGLAQRCSGSAKSHCVTFPIFFSSLTPPNYYSLQKVILEELLNLSWLLFLEDGGMTSKGSSSSDNLWLHHDLHRWKTFPRTELLFRVEQMTSRCRMTQDTTSTPGKPLGFVLESFFQSRNPLARLWCTPTVFLTTCDCSQILFRKSHNPGSHTPNEKMLSKTESFLWPLHENKPTDVRWFWNCLFALWEKGCDTEWKQSSITEDIESISFWL